LGVFRPFLWWRLSLDTKNPPPPRRREGGADSRRFCSGGRGGTPRGRPSFLLGSRGSQTRGGHHVCALRFFSPPRVREAPLWGGMGQHGAQKIWAFCFCFGGAIFSPPGVFLVPTAHNKEQNASTKGGGGRYRALRLFLSTPPGPWSWFLDFGWLFSSHFFVFARTKENNKTQAHKHFVLLIPGQKGDKNKKKKTQKKKPGHPHPVVRGGRGGRFFFIFPQRGTVGEGGGGFSHQKTEKTLFLGGGGGGGPGGGGETFGGGWGPFFKQEKPQNKKPFFCIRKKRKTCFRGLEGSTTRQHLGWGNPVRGAGGVGRAFWTPRGRKKKEQTNNGGLLFTKNAKE